MRERCRVCHRKLVVKQSKEREVGIKCFRKFNKGYRGVQIKQGESIASLRKKLGCKT